MAEGTGFLFDDESSRDMHFHPLQCRDGLITEILFVFVMLCNHRRWKVEKVVGAEHCYLRGLSLSRGGLHGGMPPPGKYCQEIEFGGI